jgi:hypothetical protein
MKMILGGGALGGLSGIPGVGGAMPGMLQLAPLLRMFK